MTAAGHEVVVLEGRDEVGGRSRSRPVTGDVIELGARFISQNHRCMRKLVADAGLHLTRDHYAVWPQDRLTWGTYAHLPPGRFTQFRRSLPHRHGRVHFAGAERSSWPIYMEGAVESGEQAAQSITATERLN